MLIQSYLKLSRVRPKRVCLARKKKKPPEKIQVSSLGEIYIQSGQKVQGDQKTIFFLHVMDRDASGRA